MKLPIFVLALLCLSLNAFGQFSLGIKGGVSQVLTPTDTKDFVSLAPTELNRISVGAVSGQRKALGLSLLGQNEKLFFMLDGMYTQTTENFQLIASGLGLSLIHI